MKDQILHLKNLINVVRQIPHLSDGWTTVQNLLLSKVQELQEKHLEKEKSDDTKCPRCFTLWNKGQYTVQSKPKRTIRKNKRINIPITRRFIIECLVCSYKKYIHLSYQQPTFKSRTKKVRNIRLKRTEEKLEQKENNKKMKKKSEMTKRLKQREKNLETKEITKTTQTLNQKQNDMKTKDKLKKVKKLKQEGNGIKITKSKEKMKEKKRILTFLNDFIK